MILPTDSLNGSIMDKEILFSCCLFCPLAKPKSIDFYLHVFAHILIICILACFPQSECEPSAPLSNEHQLTRNVCFLKRKQFIKDDMFSILHFNCGMPLDKSAYFTRIQHSRHYDSPLFTAAAHCLEYWPKSTTLTLQKRVQTVRRISPMSKSLRTLSENSEVKKREVKHRIYNFFSKENMIIIINFIFIIL